MSNIKKLLNESIHFLSSIKHLIFYKAKKDNCEIEIITFSIIPKLTKLWYKIADTKLLNKKIIIGDCSGELHSYLHETKPTILPMTNLDHGFKIDYFLRNACSTQYTIISDDDIMIYDEEPIKWAVDQLKNHKHLAVVSLMPRPNKTQWVPNVEAIMGAYCLVVNRNIIVNNNILFQVVKPSGWKKVGNHFDTGDYAHKRLIELGYDVIIAPKHVREKILSFTSIGLWGKRILSTKGHINRAVRSSRPDEYKKAFRTSLVLKYLESIGKQNGNDLDRTYIDRSIQVCRKILETSTILDIENDIYGKIEKINSNMAHV